MKFRASYNEIEKIICCNISQKKQIYEAVWDDIPVSVDAKVECMIYSIRKKLKKYTDREYIQTVWGVGYKFDPGP